MKRIGIACITRCFLAGNLLAAEPDPLRLGHVVEPVAQWVEVDLDPALEGYKGTVRIDLRFNAATNSFRFHAQDLTLERATLDGQTLALETGEPGLVSAASRENIPAGIHVLEITFTNNFNTDAVGLYQAKLGSESYLFTQFEATYARTAFPCWDEPGFKIPWRMTVHAPVELTVVGNMPVAEVKTNGNKKVIDFGRTPPMPTYLVALAVGPMESREVAGQSVPGRIYTPRGQGHLADFAAGEMPPLLSALERYFELPYPYPKLDHIGVPEFMFGAMENAGAITYRDSLLLLDAQRLSYSQQRQTIMIIGHEMAHMWFGNLVTMAWWDDLWLNESFATWMSYKIAHQVRPELRFDLLGCDSIAAARSADAQPSVKPIRRPFKADDNILEAVDTLTYNKGQAILTMLEGWLGEEQFRQVMRSYFVRHRWGNARGEDLWAAFAESGGEQIKEIVRRYIEQPGIPQLSFQRLPEDRLEVRQSRYRTLVGSQAADQTWLVPVVLRYESGGESKTHRFVLEQSSEVITVPGLSAATWLHPNSRESGYYNWSLPAEFTAALSGAARRRLSTIERLGVIHGGNRAVASGALPADQYLALLAIFAADPEPEVQKLVVDQLSDFHQTYARAEEEQVFADFLQRTLRPMLDRAGWQPRAGEAPQWGPLRASLIRCLGLRANDPAAIAFCREKARRLLSDPGSVDPAIAEAALAVASWHGDEQWSQQLRRAFEAATEPDLRARFLEAIFPCADHAITRSSLDYALSGKVRPSELFPAFASSLYPGLSPVVFDWVVARYDDVSKLVPQDFLGFLPFVLTEADEAVLAKGREFFLDPARTSPMTQVELRKAAESVHLRSALQKLNRARVIEAITKLASEPKS